MILVIKWMPSPLWRWSSLKDILWQKAPKTVWKSLICLICCLPKHFRSLLLHSEAASNTRKHLAAKPPSSTPATLVHPYLCTLAPLSCASCSANQAREEPQPQKHHMWFSFGKRMEEYSEEALQGFFFFFKSDEFPNPFDSKGFSGNTNRFYYN